MSGREKESRGSGRERESGGSGCETESGSRREQEGGEGGREEESGGGGRGREGGSGREHRVSKWEWVAGAVGAVLVVAALVIILRGARESAEPPSLEVRVDSVTQDAHGFVAHFTATNHGTAPAEQVEVEGALAGGADAPRSHATLDYLPGHSSSSGGLLFEEDPRPRGLRVRALGYAQP